MIKIKDLFLQIVNMQLYYIYCNWKFVSRLSLISRQKLRW